MVVIVNIVYLVVIEIGWDLRQSAAHLSRDAVEDSGEHAFVHPSSGKRTAHQVFFVGPDAYFPADTSWLPRNPLGSA